MTSRDIEGAFVVKIEKEEELEEEEEEGESAAARGDSDVGHGRGASVAPGSRGRRGGGGGMQDASSPPPPPERDMLASNSVDDVHMEQDDRWKGRDDPIPAEGIYM